MCGEGREVASQADSSSGQPCLIYSHHQLSVGGNPKASMCDALRDCIPLRGLPPTTLGHKPGTLLALDTYMAFADVLLRSD